MTRPPSTIASAASITLAVLLCAAPGVGQESGDVGASEPAPSADSTTTAGPAPLDAWSGLDNAPEPWTGRRSQEGAEQFVAPDGNDLTVRMLSYDTERLRAVLLLVEGAITQDDLGEAELEEMTRSALEQVVYRFAERPDELERMECGGTIVPVIGYSYTAPMGGGLVDFYACSRRGGRWATIAVVVDRDGSGAEPSEPVRAFLRWAGEVRWDGAP